MNRLCKLCDWFHAWRVRRRYPRAFRGYNTRDCQAHYQTDHGRARANMRHGWHG